MTYIPHRKTAITPTRRDVSQKAIGVTKYVVETRQGQRSADPPSNYRDNSRKNHLWQIWCEHGAAAPPAPPTTRSACRVRRSHCRSSNQR